MIGLNQQRKSHASSRSFGGMSAGSFSRTAAGNRAYAGCGKTYRLWQKALAADDPIILSFTNKAIQNVKSVLCDVYNNYELAKKCYTFDLFFCDHHGRDITALEDKTIFVYEYSMTPNKWMTRLYQAFTKYRLSIYMFGDTN